MLTEPVVGANSARCPSCDAWVIVTHDRCRPIRPGVVETTCPIETCRTTFEVQNHECRLWEIPRAGSNGAISSKVSLETSETG